MKEDRTLRKYTILSSGNVDLLHAAIANALWTVTNPGRIDVFRCDPKLSREEQFCQYLEARLEDEDYVDMLIFDNMHSRRFKRFKVLNFGFFESFVNHLTHKKKESVCDIIYLPICPMSSENEQDTYHGIKYFEGLHVEFADIGAICISKAGAQQLLARLRRNPIPMPGVFCFKDALVKPYEWKYERGAYD